MGDLFMQSDARLSECGLYRYSLTRTWDSSISPAVFVMLNPSTADGTVDDPTIKRCMSFAQTWGRGGIAVVNLFAFRATDPDAMKAASDPVGPENDAEILRCVAGADRVVAAWGVHGGYKGRDSAVVELLRKAGRSMACFGTTKDGYPRHPLYVATATPLALFAGTP